MPNNIDSLQIGIYAATTQAQNNIKDLITSLNNLKKALYTGSDASGFTKNIGKMVSGIEHLGNAISSVDINSVKEMAGALDSLSKSAQKFSNNSLTNVGKKSALSASVKNQIEELKASKKSYDAIIKDFYSLVPADTALPKNWVSKLGEDDAKRKRAIYGVNRTHVSQGGMNNWQEVYEAAGNSGLMSWDELAAIPGDEVDALSIIIDRLAEIKEKSSAASAEMKKLRASATENMPSFNEIFGENEIASADKFSGVQQVTQSVSNMGGEIGNNIRQLAEGLSTLQGIYIPADQFSGLSKIASATAALSASNGANVSQTIKSVASGVTELSSVIGTIPDTTPLVNIASAVNKFGYQSSGNAGINLTNISRGLSELVKVDFSSVNTQSLEGIATALRGFGYKNVTHAAENLPKLAVGFTQLAQSLANAPEVSENTIRLAEAMAQFSHRTDAMGQNVNRLGNHSKRHIRSIRSLASTFGMLYANFFLVIRGARLAGKAIEYSSQMTEAMNVVDVAFGKSNNVMKDFMDTSISEFGLGRLAAAQYSSRFQAMGKAMGISARDVGKANDFITKKTYGNANAYKDLGTSVADMSVNLTKLTADMASLYNQDYDSVAQDMQAVYTGMTRPLRKYGIDLTVASMKEFALKNGLDADIESMTQAEKTLLRYQIVMSQASGAMGDFQKTADTWANAMRTVKQLLQEFGRLLGEAFIQAFRPALLAFRNFMYTMLDLTQKALNAVGKLLGWEKIDFGGAALAEDMSDYADALDDAAGNAKKLKGQLRGIDELNNLTTTDKGGGAGGGSGTLGYNGNDIWDNIKETREKYLSDVESWKELGQRIADKIYEGLVSVDWDSRTEGARNFGTNLAGFLNGLIDPKTFKEVGKTIAKTIMLGVNFADAFADEFEWLELGTSIGEGINGFFENFDGIQAAEAITKIAHGLDAALTRAAGQINWNEVFRDLFTFFGKLAIDNFDLVVKYLAISNAIGFAVSFGGTLLQEVGKQLAAQIMAKAGVNLAGVTITNIGSSFGVNLAQGVAGKLAQQVGSKVTSELATQGVAAEISNVNITPKSGMNVVGAGTVGGYIGAAIVTAILGYMAGDWLQEQISNFTGSDTWLFDKMPKPGVDGGYKYDPTKNGKKLTNKEYLDEQAKKKGGIGDVGNGAYDNLKKYRTFTNTSRSVSQQIYDTKAAAAFNKLNNATITTSKNASTASTAFVNMGKEVSRSSSSAFSDLSKSSSSAFNKVAVSGKTTSTSVTNGLNTIKTSGDKTFSYNVWDSYGKNISGSVGASIDDVKSRWEALQRSMGSSVSVSVGGGSSSGGSAYIPSTTVSTVKNYDAPGVKTTPTWHNLPSKPSGMPTSAWESYLANWKKNNPGNFYASGGFPSVGSLMIAGEAGAELVGSVNGRTGVASNMEITGIREAILQTASEEVVLLRQQNQLLQGILEKEFGFSEDALFRSVRNSANNFTVRTGRPAF